MSTSAETPEGAQLKRMLDKANEMSTQRAQLTEQLKKQLHADDLTKRLLSEKDVDNTVSLWHFLVYLLKGLKCTEINCHRTGILSISTEFWFHRIFPTLQYLCDTIFLICLSLAGHLRPRAVQARQAEGADRAELERSAEHSVRAHRR